MKLSLAPTCLRLHTSSSLANKPATECALSGTATAQAVIEGMSTLLVPH